jgi:ribonuclease-3
MCTENDLLGIQQNISYEFNDKSLLILALTHPSFHQHDKTKPNNQRLEFLGDSVLSLLLTDELYGNLPDANEGELTQYRASLIRGESLAELARHLEIQDYIRLSPSEKNNQGNLRQSTLEDAMEALIGALYLDCGIVETKKLVLGWMLNLWGDLTQNLSNHNPKGKIQEWVQENHA